MHGMVDLVLSYLYFWWSFKKVLWISSHMRWNPSYTSKGCLLGCTKISIDFPDDGAWKQFHKQLQHFPMEYEEISEEPEQAALKKVNSKKLKKLKIKKHW
ncbi:unnamed protein product [Camellia sinensis]